MAGMGGFGDEQLQGDHTFVENPADFGAEPMEGVEYDPADPVDMLLAMTEEKVGDKPRPLDFVRVKLQELKKENRRLKDRVADLEQTLSIVQTAQEWTLGKGMTQEQAEKMREIKSLLEQAKSARQDMNNFSQASRATLYEKLRACKLALKRERESKQEMKERLMHAFDRARVIKETNQQLLQSQDSQRQHYEETIRRIKDQHRNDLMRLQGEGAVMQADRQEQLSYFGEQAIQDLAKLQQHLRHLRASTVDGVELVEEELPPDEDSGAFEGVEPGDSAELIEGDLGE